jgi:uncharacterized protein DUF6893
MGSSGKGRQMISKLIKLSVVAGVVAVVVVALPDIKRYLKLRAM